MGTERKNSPGQSTEICSHVSKYYIIYVSYQEYVYGMTSITKFIIVIGNQRFPNQNRMFLKAQNPFSSCFMNIISTYRWYKISESFSKWPN